MAKTEYHEWIKGEIIQWQGEGLISADQSSVLQSRYPGELGNRSWGVIIFSCLGAVIVGLGVILLLAYNWDQIPKFAKLSIILGGIAAAHATGGALFLRSLRFQALGEGIMLLGTMLFGAGIWLVAQIYHIDEHYPTAFLIWSLGALLMALVIPSIPQAILAAVLLTVWCGAERMAFDAPMWVAPACLFLILGPLAYLRRSRLLLAVVIPAFFLSYGFLLPTGGDFSWALFCSLLSLAAALIAWSRWVRTAGVFPEAGPVLGFYGWAIYLIMLYLMSFPGLAHELFYWHDRELTWVHYCYALLPLTLALISWAVMIRCQVAGKTVRERGDPGGEVYLVPLTVILGVFDLLMSSHVDGWMMAGPFNLVFLGLVVAMMVRGCGEGQLKPIILGSVLLVALVIARYFDLFESMLVRGIVFVAVGGVLLVEGVFYARAKKQVSQEGVQ